MNFNKIYRNSVMAAATMLCAGITATMASCSDDDDDKFNGEPYFYLEEAPDGVIKIEQLGLGKDEWAFGTGTHMTVRANGHWSVEPANGDETFPDWLKVFPLEGDNDGTLRFYAVPNTLAQVRSYELNVVLNGQTIDKKIIIRQDKSGPIITFSADNVQMQRGGGTNRIAVNANFDWTFEINDASRASEWLTVTREGDYLIVSSDVPNNTGDDRSAVISIIGVEDPTVRYDINITQVFAIFFDDFSWAHVHVYEGDEVNNNKSGNTGHGCGDEGIRVDECPTCYTQDNDMKQEYGATWYGNGKADQRIDKTTCREILDAGWTSCGAAVGANGPLFYCRYHFVKFGSSAGIGNAASPKIPEIEGTVNASVSFNIVGHSSAKDSRDKICDMYVSILGPGKIVGAEAVAPSTAQVMSGQFTAPYNSTASEAVADVELSEWAYCHVDTKSNAYFGKADRLGVDCWNAPESLFTVKVEGMTKDTRIVFIGGDPRVHHMKANWAGTGFVVGRMYMKNFKVVTD